MTLQNMTLGDEVEHFLAQCQEIAATCCDETTAPRFRALQAEEVKLRKRLDATRVAEKEPHLAAGRAVDAKYQPLIGKVQDAVKAVTRSLTAFMEAEHAKREEEARQARIKAEEDRKRADALAHEAAAEEDPFDAFDKGEEARRVEAQSVSLARQAAEPVKVNVVGSEGGRAAGLRIVGWIVEVEDPAALVAHYADRMEFLDLAKQLAARDAKASKGQAKIPGVRLIADRRAA